MSENFLKFKRKSNAGRIIKSLIYGISAGLISAGLFLVLSKLCVIDIDPVISLPLGVFAALLAGALLFFVLKKSDLALARELDRSFQLDERVSTMLAYQGEAGVLLDIQREDTDKALFGVPIKSYKFKRLWISFVAFGAGLAFIAAGIIVPNMRSYEPPEKVVPFELSEIQRAGIKELISYVDKSDMEEPYKGEISDELERLLGVLEATKTQPEMQAALAESMAYILASTSSSSSMTEIANALWNADDEYTKMLAKVINTGEWSASDSWWGDYAEKYSEFKALFGHVTADGETIPSEEELHSELVSKLQYSALKIEGALVQAGISANDRLVMAVNDLLNTNYDDASGPVLGLKPLASWIADLTYADAEAALEKTLGSTTNGIFDAISQQKINTNVGEYTMTKLSTLFLVPLPGFERPDFTKSGADEGSDEDKDDDKDDSEGEGGGIGTGATYGSDDYVLDPSTGEYVKYGTLLSKYYAVMNAKLESGGYTEAQKEAIIKYFDLLYGGIKKDEGE